jgi:hypothetical protein
MKTDGMASELEQIQNRTGPVVEIVRSGGPRHVSSDDLRTERRWHEFATVASGHGFRALIVTGLLPTVGPDALAGALTVYSRNPRGSANHFAVGYARFAHAHSSELADLRGAHLRRAIDSRGIIGQAKDILTNRRGISADKAFALLRPTSQDLNVKVIDVARVLTTRHNDLEQS